MLEQLEKAVGKIVKVTFESKRCKGIYEMTGIVEMTGPYRTIFMEGFETDYPMQTDPNWPTALLTERIKSVEVLPVVCDTCPDTKECLTFQNAKTLPTKCLTRIRKEEA